jgi:iron uptake system EfeUOB component EfeO/EfeM
MGNMDVNNKGGPVMKNIKPFSSLLIVGLLLGGCGGNDNAEEVKEVTPDEESKPAADDEKTEENSSNDENAMNLTAGVEETTNSLEELSMTLTDTPDDTKKLNEQGSKIEEKWDQIEKQVEDNYPDDYENIEKSLYPLIEEAKKDTPDAENLKNLTEDTMNKMNEFHGKVKNQ